MKNSARLSAALSLCLAAFASGDTVTYQYSAGDGTFTNSSGFVNFDNGTGNVFISDSGASQFPAISDFVENDKSVNGSFSFPSDAPPDDVSGNQATFFPPGATFSLSLPTSSSGNAASQTNLEFGGQAFGVTKLDPSNGQYADQFYADGYNNTAESPLVLTTTGTDFKLDLETSLQDNSSLPDLSSMPIHVLGVSSLELGSTSVLVTGKSGLIDRGDALPPQIDLPTVKAEGGDQYVTMDFEGQSSNIYVDPNDYSSQADYQTAENFIQQNVSSVQVDEYITYSLSHLASDAPPSGVTAPPGYYFTGSRSEGDGQFSYHEVSTNGGVGRSTANSFVGGTTGTTSGNAYIDSNGNPAIGVSASAATYYNLESRSVAYNSYLYSGADHAPFTLNLAFKGSYTDPPFQLASGGFNFEMGALILDRTSFNAYVAANGTDFLTSDTIDELREALGASVLGDAEAGNTNQFGSVNMSENADGSYDLTALLQTNGISIPTGEDFVVLLDMYAESDGGGMNQGGPDLYFADTFQFGLVPFQDQNGQPVADITTIPAPEPTAAAVMISGVAFLFRRRRAF